MYEIMLLLSSIKKMGNFTYYFLISWQIISYVLAKSIFMFLTHLFFELHSFLNRTFSKFIRILDFKLLVFLRVNESFYLISLPTI